MPNNRAYLNYLRKIDIKIESLIFLKYLINVYFVNNINSK